MESTLINVSVNVTTEDNTPIQGAVITLTNTNSNEDYESSATGSAGGCTISNIPEGTYTVAAICSGYEDYEGIEEVTIDKENKNIAIVMTASESEE